MNEEAQPEVLPSRSKPVRAALPPKRARNLAHWFRLRQDVPAWLYKSLVAFSFTFMLAAWVWLSHQSFVNHVFLPTPERVWQTACDFLGDPNIWKDLKSSIFRVSARFLLAAALALPIGVWLGSYKA